MFRHPIARMLLSAVVLALPFALAVAQLAVRHQATLADLSPAPYPNGTTSDSLYYWHQAASFAVQGMRSGYYTVGEQPAPAPFSPFYTWGMFVPAFYGMLGAVFGWQLNSIPIINLVLLTLALALYIAVMRPNIPQLLLLGGFIITSNALHIQYAASMTTVLHLALAVTLASFASWRFEDDPERQDARDAKRKPASLLSVLFLLCLLLVSTLLLPTWGTLFVFVGALLLRGHWTRVAIGVLVGGGVFAALTLLVQSTGAPFANPLTEMLNAARSSPADGMARLLDNIRLNVSYTLQGSLVEVVTRLQTLLVALIMLAGWVLPRLTGRWFAGWTRMELAFHALNLGSVYLIALLFYEQTAGRDYRLFAPRLLLSALVLVGMKRYRMAVVLLATMGLVLPNALYDGGAWAEAHISRDGHAFFYETRAALNTVASYDEGNAPARWCNSVLMSFVYVSEMPAVPLAFSPGIGLSWGIEALQPETVQARYLLLTDADAARFPAWQLGERVSLPGGSLYINNANLCLP
ncbi:MAG: hypothetical protein SF123_24020 [Chloroflexota bacterium]|nr:hypothetical protein [Chloroflexota bacterium]